MKDALKAAKEESNYKYLIHYLLNQLPHNKYKLALKHLPKKLGVSPETFRKWKYIKKNDRATIPADQLALIAKFFKISIEDMFNYELKDLSFDTLQEAERKK